MYIAVQGSETPAFQEKELNGHKYRLALGVKQRFKLGLAHWHPRKTELLPMALGHEIDPNDPIKNPVLDKTEKIEATPYLESTGARDTGKAFLWTEYRMNAGRGIIAIPYQGWKPEDDLITHDTGTITLIATEDFQQVLNHPEGFVLAEPSDGWKNVHGSDLPSDEKINHYLAVGVGLAVIVGAVLWSKRS